MAALGDLGDGIARERDPPYDVDALEVELADVTADLDRVVNAICKVGVSAALEVKLKTLEQRKRDLAGELRAADVTVALPDRTAIAAKWRSLVDGIGELPARLNATEIDSARTTLKEFIGEVRVDRTGTGYAELRLQRLVAGVGFGFSFPAHDPPRRSTRTPVKGGRHPQRGPGFEQRSPD